MNGRPGLQNQPHIIQINIQPGAQLRHLRVITLIQHLANHLERLRLVSQPHSTLSPSSLHPLTCE